MERAALMRIVVGDPVERFVVDLDCSLVAGRNVIALRRSRSGADERG